MSCPALGMSLVFTRTSLEREKPITTTYLSQSHFLHISNTVEDTIQYAAYAITRRSIATYPDVSESYDDTYLCSIDVLIFEVRQKYARRKKIYTKEGELCIAQDFRSPFSFENNFRVTHFSRKKRSEIIVPVLSVHHQSRFCESRGNLFTLRGPAKSPRGKFRRDQNAHSHKRLSFPAASSRLHLLVVSDKSLTGQSRFNRYHCAPPRQRILIIYPRISVGFVSPLPIA